MGTRSGFRERPTKSVSTLQLEEAISKALTDLLGFAYSVQIANLRFEPNSALSDTIELTLEASLANPTDLLREDQAGE